MFSSSVLGGSPPYAYQWYLDDVAVPDATSSTWIFSPTSYGRYKTHLLIIDSSTTAESNHIPITVNPPLSVSIHPLSVVISVNQSQTFTSSVLGGTIPYTYQWFLDGIAIPSATYSNWTFTPSSTGSYQLHLKVTDDVSSSAESTIALITARSGPKATFSYTPFHPHVNETIAFDASASTPNGGAISNYTWSFGDNETIVMTSSIATHVFAIKGNYTVVLIVTDNEGLSDRASQTITIYAGAPCANPMIDVYTQQPDPYSGKGVNMSSDAFAPGEEVALYAYVSLNHEPIENSSVTFEVRNPLGETVILRIAASNAEGIAASTFQLPSESKEAETLFGKWAIYGSFEICERTIIDNCTFKFGWLVEITLVETVDSNGHSKSDFVKCETICFNITLENIAYSSRTATLALAIYDECCVPIGHVVLDRQLISSGIAELFIIGMPIPEWAYVGLGRIYASVFTDLPQHYGTPYCPEAFITFLILES
ncbi:MAG: PKD domain-containing protein [Candidatus Bathyarchaeota archaeon]|nr:MAG: PKD domain-containing protein [Candidatus Bathyarchaeota archaeon]